MLRYSYHGYLLESDKNCYIRYMFKFSVSYQNNAFVSPYYIGVHVRKL